MKVKPLPQLSPLYLNALTGRGAHLVTVNDYLALRDSQEMGKLYNWLGLKVGCITANMDDEDRKAAMKPTLPMAQTMNSLSTISEII